MPKLPTRADGAPSPILRWLPLIVLAAAIAAAYSLGLHRYLTLEAMAANRESLSDFVDAHRLAALAGFMVLYIAVVAVSLPVAVPLSIAGGFLFGWVAAAATVTIAATIGAMIVFLIVRASLGGMLAEKAGSLAKRLTEGFNRDAFSYLLFLRLVPAFPFFAVNAAAGLTGISLRTFTLATFIGIIPGTIAFCYLGTGLDSVIAAQKKNFDECVAASGAANCSFTLDAGSLVTSELITAMVALGVIALVPVLLRRWRMKKA